MNAVSITDLSKVYRLYDRHADLIKEALHPFRKKYHEKYFALKDIDIEIARGETVGIIGRNGSGKSTLLKIMAGIITPTSGNISIQGKVAALLELGAGFNPELTGVENIYFSGIVMGLTREEMDERLDGIAAFADIGDYIRQPVKMYSSGMFIRLAFSVAINVDPDILIIDEALAVGDISFQAKCFRRISDFRQAGKTVIIVTHALDSVIRHCHKAIVLDAGRKAVEADPKAAVDEYKKLMAKCDQQLPPPRPQTTTTEHSGARLMDRFNVDPHALSYGNSLAEIVDFGLFDEQEEPVQILYNGQPFIIKMKVAFHADIESPVFAYTIKDLKGMELTGTNSQFKQIPTGSFHKGEFALVTFSQALNSQCGRYSLSLGCTNFDLDQFVVYHRLYDLLLFEVISEEPMVGFYDLDSRIEVKRIEDSGSAD